jgi:hypothetical protein
VLPHRLCRRILHLLPHLAVVGTEVRQQTMVYGYPATQPLERSALLAALRQLAEPIPRAHAYRREALSKRRSVASRPASPSRASIDSKKRDTSSGEREDEGPVVLSCHIKQAPHMAR